MKFFALAVSFVFALSALPAPQADTTFLGFDLGEERRYVLGPPQKLYIGESATWSIHLREIMAEPRHGIFELAHTWEPPSSSSAVSVVVTAISTLPSPFKSPAAMPRTSTLLLLSDPSTLVGQPALSTGAPSIHSWT